jgi:2-dehydropantoate 2-reductase
MAMEPISVAVLGPGGVGGLVAALMARAGDSVQVLAGDETATAIDQGGLRVESARFGDFTARVETTARLEAAVDVCFVTVKATHLSEALERVTAEVIGEGLLIPFLNGIDHIDHLRATYPPNAVVAATIRIETARVGPGLIRHSSPFALVEIAPAAANRSRVELVAEHLKSAGFDVRLRDDEHAMLWDKLALLEPMALLTTHERAGVGVIRTKRREDAIALIFEVVAVAGAEGAVVDGEAVVKMMDSVPESMESSMQRDQAAGRPLELDALGGAVLRRAARAGVPVPVTRRLVDELRTRTAPPVAGG